MLMEPSDSFSTEVIVEKQNPVLGKRKKNSLLVDGQMFGLCRLDSNLVISENDFTGHFIFFVSSKTAWL